MHAHVITIFPRLIEGFVTAGIPRIAVEKGALSVSAVDLRDFTQDVHRTVDDRPFGGGPGMVMRCEPIVAAVEHVERAHGPMHRVLLTPRGRRLDQEKLRSLASEPALLLLCGHYEGIDERVRMVMDWDEISIGDYVVSGGEVAALVLLDGVARLLPGVVGDPASIRTESFEDGLDGLLEAPHYTRPREFRGLAVPEVLLNGDHAAIEAWRREQSLKVTEERRADLLLEHSEQDGRSPERRTEGKPWIE
jgi:tRNA (guanine37-N1)-methyltransferase